MIAGILKESPGENRVIMLPETVAELIRKKVEVWVESDAGAGAFTADDQYEKAGAKILSREKILAGATMILQISPPDDVTLKKLRTDQVWIGVLNPLSDKSLVGKFLELKLTSFSLDVIPRTSRAQAMDILSSQATAAGYRAVLDAAMHLPTFFPMFMTAAGTITPAKVLILGAGVAGLQAISTARRLGAKVEAFDVRAAVREEVVSLGAKFVEVDGSRDEASAGGYAVEQSEEYKKKQQQAVHDHAVKSDVVICTAQIPGRPAPKLLLTPTVEAMKPGAVIVDLAASSGGNCDLTVNAQTIDHKGVLIIGQSAYPSSLPKDASKMLGKNVLNFLSLLITPEGELNLNFSDDLVTGTCVTHQGEIYNPRVKSLF
ncbi:MAG: NAD(P) transhydrogenase subunit alpha [Bacteroidetes bacterium GWF2_49_14]|nr:MAG: NAD(P) transhydrogenase subunit alpha [Bacteroidetes bacterium GWF2_49_14]HBB91430.1 Re/Si-specific NAD(P)(+) transhydrogenase subunit alpha [Bacteroidales bacterium]